jgi:WD40 repeat protein
MRAISVSDDKTLRLWDLQSGELIHTFEGHIGLVNCVAVTPDGRHAVSASNDKTLRLWDLHSGKCLLLLSSEAPFGAVAISPDNKTIVAGDAAGVVHFIEIHNLE